MCFPEYTSGIWCLLYVGVLLLSFWLSLHERRSHERAQHGKE